MRIEITGSRGCGKTTMANKIKAMLEKEGKMVFVDPQRFDCDQADVVIITSTGA